ncbi:hypothetical protein J4Q44_G00140810 [Coregonus suidteri]|uniref:Uncharacterized protein n=1 Tax=Coregonus suidteri TaxID=861788 RepID=A0AAN8LPU1_9TELE
MPRRRSWGQASHGIRTASGVLSVGRAWSLPPRQRKMERSTAKHVTQRTLDPKDLVMARELGLWCMPNDDHQTTLKTMPFVYF